MAIAEYIPHMSTDFQLRVRRRLAELGLSYRAASLEAGLSPEAVGKMLKADAGLPRGGSLAGLARALQTTEQWLLSGDGEEAMQLSPSHEGVRDLHYDDGDVDIKAVAAGSYEGAFQISESSIGRAPLPRGLKRFGDVYAIIVINDSMYPEHKPGELRFVTPDMRPKLGDSVVVEFERDPDRGPEAMIGHLEANGPTVRISKLNPPGNVEVAANQLRRLHRIATQNEVSSR